MKKAGFDQKNEILRRVEGLLEIAALTVMYYITWRMYYRVYDTHAFLGRGKFVLVGIYFLLMLFMFTFLEGFRYGYLKLSDVVISQWLSILVVNFITYFQLGLISAVMQYVVPFLVLTAAEFLVAFLCSFVCSKIYHRFSSSQHLLMVYGTDKAINLKVKMDAHGDMYNVEKFIHCDEGLENICREAEKFDAVILNDIPATVRNDVLKFCYEKRILTYVVPKISDIIIKGAENITLYDTPLFLVNARGLSYSQKLIKRGMDIVLTLIALIPGLVIMGITAIAIKLGDGGPVFFRQERVTIDGRVFSIIKFRSMVVDADKIQTPHMAENDDPRITKVGRVIRKFRIDELPQLFNILKGEMSIVGPRPERCEHVEKYTAEIPEFVYRNSVKAGLTGYAQVYGKYNTTAYDKLRLDLIYIENYSFVLDIKLIFLTFQTMFHAESTEGADVAAEMEKRSEEILAEIREEKNS